MAKIVQYKCYFSFEDLAKVGSIVDVKQTALARFWRDMEEKHVIISGNPVVDIQQSLFGCGLTVTVKAWQQE